MGDGNDKVVSYGSLSSSGLTLEGVETLEIHSLFTTNSFFLKHWGGNDIIFAGSQDHTLRIQIVEDLVTGEYITDIDLSMFTVAQGNLNIEIYGPPGLTLDSTYDISEVKVISPASSQVGIEVFHDDRDIEFIQFKRWLENLYADATLKLDYKSCEMMADELNSIIQQRYEGRGTIIEVSEDGENGCTIMFPPKGKKTEFATYQEMMSSTNPSASAGEQ